MSPCFRKLGMEARDFSRVRLHKNRSNAYTSKLFKEFMKAHDYSEVAVCGLDECGCAGATAEGAAKTGAEVIMLENCIGSRFPDAEVQKMRKKLRALGIRYIEL